MTQKRPVPRAVVEQFIDAAHRESRSEHLVRMLGREIGGQIAEAQQAQRPRRTAKGHHGPRPMTNAAEVEAKRLELQKEGKWAGERSIATALGVSRDAVRYALGKDRRR